MATMNRQIVLAARPEGLPKPSDFRLVEAPVPELAEGQFLVKTNYLSVDPYMRGRISEAKSYAEPVQIGEVMVGGTVGTVVESRHPGYRPGEVVVGYWGWQEYAVSDGQGIERFDTSLAPMSTALGVLGMPGMTAYFGLLEIGKPKPGETVFVSGAAGAVGSLVGQIAKIKGCRVVGSAGSQPKVDYLTGELGFDAAFNYKEVKDYAAKLQEVCPNGIDVYFDNVGGPLTDAVFTQINVGARIVVCGQIDQYNATRPPRGPTTALALDRQAGPRRGVPGVPVCQPVPRGSAAGGPVDQGGQGEVPGDHRGRPGERPQGVHRPVPRRERRQAVGAGGERVSNHGDSR